MFLSLRHVCYNLTSIESGGYNLENCGRNKIKLYQRHKNLVKVNIISLIELISLEVR